MTILKHVPLNSMQDHPLNAHAVSEKDRKKIANNIRRTGKYPPLIVRELTELSEYWPGAPGHYQILDGHQRRLIFEDLVAEGLTQFEQVAVDDWSPLTDDEALIALATLNTWGDNIPRRRAELLHAILKTVELQEAANVLPEDVHAITDAVKLLKQPLADIQRLIDEAQRPDEIAISFVLSASQKSALAKFTAAIQLFASYYGADMVKVEVKEGGEHGRVVVLTFNLVNAAHTLVEEAIRRASEELPPGGKNRRGQALEVIAAQYLATALKWKDQVDIEPVETERTAPPPARRKRTRKPVPEIAIAAS